MKFLTIIILFVSYFSPIILFKIFYDRSAPKLKAQNIFYIAVLSLSVFFPLYLWYKNQTTIEALFYHVLCFPAAFYCADSIIENFGSKLYKELLYILSIIGVLNCIYLPPYQFKDGDYCAQVRYYNPNTEQENTYTLSVEIEEDKVIKIKFPNGGWLDESHIEPTKISSEGIAVVIDDRDYEYTVSHLNFNGCHENEN